AASLPTVSTNGLTWTFRLKRGIHYALPLANVEITAPDIVRAHDRLGPRTVCTARADPAFSGIDGYDAYARGRAATTSGLEVPAPTHQAPPAWCRASPHVPHNAQTRCGPSNGILPEGPKVS